MSQFASANLLPGRLIEVSGTDLEFRTLSVPHGTLSGFQILAYCDRHPATDFVVLQWLPGGDLEEIRAEEPAAWTEGVVPRFIIGRTDRLFRFQLDDRVFDWPADRVAEAVLRKLGRIPATHHLYLRRGDGDAAIHPGEDVDLSMKGVEIVFSRARAWTLNVQGVPVHSDVPEVTVRSAMEKAGFDVTAAWIIILKTSAERRQVELDYVIDLRHPGVEKLRLTPREINNGEARGVVNHFALLPVDERGLAERGLTWTTMVDSGRRWLVLERMPLPAGYNAGRADVAIEVPVSYPAAELDMFYCHPFLRRTDGRDIPLTHVPQPIGGRTFQRWSRHRGIVSPWRAGRDNVLTHLALVDAALTREVE